LTYSQIQQQFKLAQSLNSENCAYNLASLFKINSSFDKKLFEKALGIISERYSWAYAVKPSYHNTAFSQEEIREAVNSPFCLENDDFFRVHLWQEDSRTHLLFLFHHIIFDLRSKDLFAQEFCVIYNALSENRAPRLEPVSPYDDYTRWYNDFSNTDKYRRMLLYWEREPLDHSILNLPTDKMRQAFPSSRGHRIFGTLPGYLKEMLNSYCLSKASDPFLVLLSAYAVFLSRFSGQDKFSIGIPRTNRPEDKFNDSIGCFVNILPLCLNLDEGITFKGLLRQVRMKMLGMHRNQNVPYLEVVKLNKGKRDAKYNPLFQTGFTFEHPMHLELNGLDVVPMDIAPDAAQLDLFFYFWQEGDKFRWAVEYCTDLFSKERVEGFFASFLTILEQGMAKDSQAVNIIPIMDKASRERIAAWNDTERDYPISGGVIETFLEQARLQPNATALKFRGESMTYGELERRVRLIASFLMAKGVGRETIVGLSLERSFEMVIGMYAIVLAGGTYLPIEPTLPADYIDYIREDVQLTLVLSKETYRSLFSGLDEFIALDIFDFNGQWEAGNFPVLDPDSRVYILYTSGSTGRPKGVEITHRGLMNRILWMDEEYRLKEDDVLFQKTPYNFDVSGWEFWWPLMKGVPLVIAEPEGHKDNAYLIDSIQNENVSIVHFVPSMLSEFLKTCQKGDCLSLRAIICSGEALPTALVREFYEIFPHAGLHNLYGPTEASIDVTYWPCAPECSVVPIGKPVANTKIHILDNALNPLPPGVTGEIYIAGVQLARGYLNKPELTAERFIANPFDGGRMYRTGDLGQWNLQGEILYLGRNDNQIQLHGLRIELGEIENRINDHPAVERAAVTVHGDFGADQSLIAFIVRRGELMKEELIAFLNQRLPLHMVPMRLLFVNEIKLNANGKIDRKSLPDPKSLESISEKSKVLPKGEGESYIAGLWKEMLGLDQVGRDENFFELGGSSLHIIQMQKKIIDKIGKSIPVTDLFIHTTIGTLARYLEQIGSSEEGKGKVKNRAELSRQAAQRFKNSRKR